MSARAGVVAGLAAALALGAGYLRVLARDTDEPVAPAGAVRAGGSPPVAPPPLVVRPSLPGRALPGPRPLAGVPRPPPPPVAPVVEAPEPLPGFVVTASGLGVRDDLVGSGPVPAPGQDVVVHYTGWVEGGDGVPIDSTADRGEPAVLPFGQGAIIKGWEEGLTTLRVGGKRTLVIPAALAYGDHGAGRAIPPGASLRFEIELVEVRDRPPLGPVAQ